MTDTTRETLQSALGSGYMLGRELGGGGMSRVFLVEDTGLKRRLVVKLLPPDLAAGAAGTVTASRVHAPSISAASRGAGFHDCTTPEE